MIIFDHLPYLLNWLQNVTPQGFLTEFFVLWWCGHFLLGIMAGSTGKKRRIRSRMRAEARSGASSEAVSSWPWWFVLKGMKYYPLIWVCPKNRGGPPKSSSLIGFSIINHPFWGTTIFGNIHTVTISWQAWDLGSPRTLKEPIRDFWWKSSAFERCSAREFGKQFEGSEMMESQAQQLHALQYYGEIQVLEPGSCCGVVRDRPNGLGQEKHRWVDSQKKNGGMSWVVTKVCKSGIFLTLSITVELESWGIQPWIDSFAAFCGRLVLHHNVLPWSLTQVAASHGDPELVTWDLWDHPLEGLGGVARTKSLCMSTYGCQPKNRGGKTPQIIHLFIGFWPLFENHPFWRFSPYFWKHSYTVCMYRYAQCNDLDLPTT